MISEEEREREREFLERCLNKALREKDEFAFLIIFNRIKLLSLSITSFQPLTE